MLGERLDFGFGPPVPGAPWTVVADPSEDGNGTGTRPPTPTPPPGATSRQIVPIAPRYNPKANDKDRQDRLQRFTDVVGGVVNSLRGTGELLMDGINAYRLGYNPAVPTAWPGTPPTTVWGALDSLISGTAPSGLVVDADAAMVTFNIGAGQVHLLVLGGNRTLAVTGETLGRTFAVILQQGGVGTNTVTWWSGIKWSGGSAPTLATAVGKVDVFTFIKIAPGSYLGFQAGANMS